MPVLIFVLVLAVTIISVVAIERGARNSENAELSRRVQSLGAAVERRAFTSSSYLRAGAALFSTRGGVDGEVFRRFVEELRLDSDYRGAEGIGWAPVISRSELPQFEAQLSQGRMEPAHVWPTLDNAPRSQLVPILYLQPDTLRNRRALGYDLYSDEIRRRAMDDATRTMLPTASGRIGLMQDGAGRDHGFLVFMPVFESGKPGRRLAGFIYNAFTGPEFLESAVGLVGGGNWPARLYDIEDGKRMLMAERPGWTADGAIIEREVHLANRPMIVAIQSNRGAGLSPLSMATLVFGLSMALLLTVVARLLTRQAEEDSRALEWFEEQNSIRNSLTRELNHRVKNTLANVLSIITLTRRRATNLDEFADGLDGRIRALSATHDLLTRSEWGTTPIGDVVEVELAPYTRGGEQQVDMSGPDVELAPNDALSLGLALHELAANAAKYGALSVETGRVAVHWDMAEGMLARIMWEEQGGPPVTPPTRRGFGTDLIEKIVAHELRHPVNLVFDRDGVRCTLMVPVREPREFALRRKTGGQD